MKTREWMRELCCLDVSRPHINAPFRTTYDGAEWDCATDGHGILLMRGPCHFETRDDSLAPENVGKVMRGRFDGEPRAVDLEALRSWAAPTVLEPGSECDECGGNGDYLQTMQAARLFGHVINRLLLWQFIKYLHNPGADAPWPGMLWTSGSPEPIALRPAVDPAPWLLVLMPLRDDGLELGEPFDALWSEP